MKSCAGDTFPPEELFTAALENHGFSIAWAIAGCEPLTPDSCIGTLAMAGSFSPAAAKKRVMSIRSKLSRFGFYVQILDLSSVRSWHETGILDNTPKWVSISLTTPKILKYDSGGLQEVTSAQELSPDYLVLVKLGLA